MKWLYEQTVCIYISVIIANNTWCFFSERINVSKIRMVFLLGKLIFKTNIYFFTHFLFLNRIKNKRNSQISLEFITSNQDISIEYRLYFYPSIKQMFCISWIYIGVLLKSSVIELKISLHVNNLCTVLCGIWFIYLSRKNAKSRIRMPMSQNIYFLFVFTY